MLEIRWSPPLPSLPPFNLSDSINVESVMMRDALMEMGGWELPALFECAQPLLRGLLFAQKEEEKEGARSTREVPYPCVGCPFVLVDGYLDLSE